MENGILYRKIYLFTAISVLTPNVFAANGAVGEANNMPPTVSRTGDDATPNGSGGYGFDLTLDMGTTPDDIIIASDVTLQGGKSSNSTGGYAGGIGLNINAGSDNTLNSLMNNGVLQGGDSLAVSGRGGNALTLNGISITTEIVNNGQITGGNGNGNGAKGGDSLLITNGSSVTKIINANAITGGSSNNAGQGGAGISLNTGASLDAIDNSGIITGGSSDTERGGNAIYLNGAGTTVINNNENGIIQGGNTGGTTTSGTGIYVASGQVNIVNEGLISGGNNSTVQREAVYLNTSGNQLELRSGGTFDGGVYANGGNQTFILNANKSGGADTFDLTGLTGSGWNSSTFEKKGAYDWILTGNSGAVRTHWNINEGNLILDNSALVNSDVTINNAGMLSGTGVVGKKTTVNSGGFISVANEDTTGTLTVGDIEFNTGSTYLVTADVNSSGVDLIKVTQNGTTGTGSAVINGGDVFVKAGNGTWQPSTTYTILESDSAVSGTFDGINTNLAFLDVELDYSIVNQVNLIITRNSFGFADIGITPNQKNTADGIESLDSSNPIVNEILNLDAVSARNAYDNLSGEIHATTQAALLSDRYIRDAINEHLLIDANQKEHGLWITSWGAMGTLKSDNNAAKADNNTFGIMLGAEQSINDTAQIGLALSYQHNDIEVATGRSSEAKIEGYHIAVYAGKNFARGLQLRGGINYGYLDIHTERYVSVGNIKEKNSDGYSGHLIQGFVEASKSIEISERLKVAPYVNIAHAYINTNNINEGNNVTALKGNGRNDITFSTVGLRGLWQLTPHAKITLASGWQHAYGSRTADTDLTFNGGSSFNINSVPISKDAIVSDVGLEIKLTSNISASINYQGQFGDKIENNAIKAGLNYRF